MDKKPASRIKNRDAGQFPELTITLMLKPGEKFTWKINHDFFTTEKQ